MSDVAVIAPVETGGDVAPTPPRSRVAVLTGIAVVLTAALGADEGMQRRGPAATNVLAPAVPVPTGASLLAREIDETQGRSIAVFDLGAGTPADWRDVVIVIRRRALPGVVVGYPTEPVTLPGPSASIDEWRALAASNAVRADPLPTLLSALEAIERRRR